MKYTKEKLIQTYGDGFYDGFRKAIEIQEECEDSDWHSTPLVEYDDDVILSISEDAESKFEDNLIDKEVSAMQDTTFAKILDSLESQIIELPEEVSNKNEFYEWLHQGA